MRHACSMSERLHGARGSAAAPSPRSTALPTAARRPTSRRSRATSRIPALRRPRQRLPAPGRHAAPGQVAACRRLAGGDPGRRALGELRRRSRRPARRAGRSQAHGPPGRLVLQRRPLRPRRLRPAGARHGPVGQLAVSSGHGTATLAVGAVPPLGDPRLAPARARVRGSDRHRPDRRDRVASRTGHGPAHGEVGIGLGGYESADFDNLLVAPTLRAGEALPPRALPRCSRRRARMTIAAPARCDASLTNP